MLACHRSIISRLALLLIPSAALAGPVDTWCEQLGKRLNSVSVDSCRAWNFIAARDLTPKGNLLVFRDIAPAGRDKRAVLYRESQFAAICEAIAGRAIAAKRAALLPA